MDVPMRSLALLIPGALVLGACTAQQPGAVAARPARAAAQCFWGSQVTGFGSAGTDRVIANIGFQQSWQLTLAAGCPDVDSAMRIGIVARGGDRICTGRPAELLVPNVSGVGMQRCLVRNVRRLTPEEAAAARGQGRKP